MIHVSKNYDEIPLSLRSQKVLEWRDQVLNGDVQKSQKFSWTPVKNIIQELNALYHDKCAYCESRLGVHSYTAVDHYRPKSHYYWLGYEWSNLFPVCPDCNTHKSNVFPLLAEQNRVMHPQVDRLQWRADSDTFLAEKPLLLNPELDEPEKHLSFHPDGRIYGLTERGTKTIEVFELNRNLLLSKRGGKIDDFRVGLKAAIQDVVEIRSQEITDKILKLAFQHLFKDLIASAAAESEYALFGRCMIKNFDEFFVEPIKEAGIRELLLRAKYHLLPEGVMENSQISKGLPADGAPTPKLVTVAVDSLEINSVKCFDQVKIQMNGKSTLILGINGRGKSTILQLLALGLSQLEKPPFYNNWYKVTKMDRDNASFEIKLTTSQGPMQLAFTIDENDAVKCVDGKDYQKIKDNLLVLAYGHGRNITGQAVAPAPYKDFEGIACLFGNTNYLKNIQNSSVYDRMKTGFAGIKKLVNEIFALAETEHTVALDDYDSEGFHFRTPTAPNGGVPLEAMSDGFKSTLVLLVDLVIRAWDKGADMKKPGNIAGIVLIDEIDLHLHPSWQRTFLPTLREVFPKIQFIVTSHSPFIVQSMVTDDIITLNVEEEGVTARKVELDGKPYGHGIEKIIKEILGAERKIPKISELLFRQLKDFEDAIKNGRYEMATSLYLEIKSALPADSGFMEYVEVMGAGLVAEDEGDE